MSAPGARHRDESTPPNEWVQTYTDPTELAAAFAGRPHPRYRPLTAWWWSAEPITKDRIRWQIDQIAALGCGGFDITGLAMHGPTAGSVADDPKWLTDQWYELYRYACEYGHERGLAVSAWSPMQIGGPLDLPRLAAEHPEFGGQEVVEVDGAPAVIPFGFDYGNPAAVAAHTAADAAAGRYAAELRALRGSASVIGFFEDEFPGFARWSATFAEEFRAAKGYDFPLPAFYSDVGPRTPAHRVALMDVATDRVVRAYTAYQRELVREHNFLAGYDQTSRTGTPRICALSYLDPFQTLAWANAPGMDHSGDARFHLSLADIHGHSRVWLEGFHSHGWGMSLDDQFRLLVEWGREGANLFLPHGMYYANRGLWWEWASPEMGWKQPYAQHYPAFADAVGRMLSFLSAGRHDPEVAVLYPLTTVWADRDGMLSWGAAAMQAEEAYLDLFGLHDVPSGWDLERAARPSRLAAAGYDRVALDEAHLDRFDIPVVVASCRCLRTETVRRLIADARRGRLVVLVEPLPDWSAERGREDAEFAALVAELARVATVVADTADVPAVLPPPRAAGLPVQWRLVDGLALAFVTGTGRVRLHGLAGRAPQRWDPRTGAITAHPARIEGADLVLDCVGPVTMLSLPPGVPVAPVAPAASAELVLPQRWRCDYVSWGENRWGDYALPPNDGTPPVQRRTFAFREGDEPSWRSAPVTPEDVQQPLIELGFKDRMWGRTGRVAPAERTLPDGWHEVVAGYGPKAQVTESDRPGAARLAEYSERLGLEDVVMFSHLGLKAKLAPAKVLLDEGSAGATIRTALYVPADTRSHLMVEGCGVLSVTVDGQDRIGPVECGVLAVPIELRAGWHDVTFALRPRSVAVSAGLSYRPRPRTWLGWALTEPYQRDPVGVWTWQVIYPELKGTPGPLRFRRRVRVSETTEVSGVFTGSAAVKSFLPPSLEAGEHDLEVEVAESAFGPHLSGVVTLRGPSGTATLTTDEHWEVREHDGQWAGVFETGMAGSWMGGPETATGTVRPALLTDAAWLETEAAVAGQPAQLWADASTAPPPAWFAFTAAPGAQAITLPIRGEVAAWLDGRPARVVDGRLALREGSRVAVRVQAPAGYRGAACFSDHPQLTLGPGTIEVGTSWHRQGLDCFSGVIRHSLALRSDRAHTVELDLGEVRGSVAVGLNGALVDVLFAAPWRTVVSLPAGESILDLDVANTLGPMVGRGVPTPYGPEDQRISGLLARPVLRGADVAAITVLPIPTDPSSPGAGAD